MSSLKVHIVGFATGDQPGFVWCELADAAGERHRFLQKIPVVSSDDRWSDSTYPQPGAVPCEVVRTWHTADGQSLSVVRVCWSGSLDEYMKDRELTVSSADLMDSR